VADTAAFLRSQREQVLAAAESALARMRARHYEGAGADEVRVRLEALFDQLVDAIATRNLAPMVAYAREVAEARFTAGYDLSEVQIAFNALEESAWAAALEGLDPADYGEALGLIGTVLGAGKDELARAYVSLAARSHTRSLDLRALFGGTEAGTEPQA
jgi:hypothetical protein